jgi:hypothetical protein
MVQLAMATWRTYAPDYEAGFDIEISTSSMIFWTWRCFKAMVWDNCWMFD